MTTVNYLTGGEGRIGVQFSLQSLNASVLSGDEPYIQRLQNLLLDSQDYQLLKSAVQAIGVTPRFRDVIKTFQVAEGETPAGFRVESKLCSDGLF